jgi:2-methylcitrate dehydratase PrpD
MIGLTNVESWPGAAGCGAAELLGAATTATATAIETAATMDVRLCLNLIP